MSIASLPMYDLPEVARATNAWWAGLARAFAGEGLDDVPDRLTRAETSAATWRAPDLLLSQTCGYPLTHEYKDDLRLVATPAYGVRGCKGPAYCSLIMVRDNDPVAELAGLRGRIAASNSRESQSGCSALRAAIAPLSDGTAFFAEVVMSGGHAQSLDLVARGEADVCAVDCVTHALLARYRPEAVHGLRCLAESPAAPGLPYVTRVGLDEDSLARLRAGLRAALDDPALAEPRAALFIEGAEVLPSDAYGRILELERMARDLGYPELA